MFTEVVTVKSSSPAPFYPALLEIEEAIFVIEKNLQDFQETDYKLRLELNKIAGVRAQDWCLRFINDTLKKLQDFAEPIVTLKNKTVSLTQSLGAITHEDAKAINNGLKKIMSLMHEFNQKLDLEKYNNQFSKVCECHQNDLAIFYQRAKAHRHSVFKQFRMMTDRIARIFQQTTDVKQLENLRHHAQLTHTVPPAKTQTQTPILITPFTAIPPCKSAEVSRSNWQTLKSKLVHFKQIIYHTALAVLRNLSKLRHLCCLTCSRNKKSPSHTNLYNSQKMVTKYWGKSDSTQFIDRDAFREKLLNRIESEQLPLTPLRTPMLWEVKKP